MELHFRGAAELARMIRSREIGSVELLEHMLARVQSDNPTINAVVTLDAERALEQARAADAELARGEVRGPLHGLPITVKDAFETAGLRTTAGAKLHAEHVPERNATAVQRLLDAGAVLFGKTNLPSFSLDSVTHNPLFGTTHNPYDPKRTPGGSSGGSAAALAAGLTCLELGSDVGGSIRLPAHWTGVFGHKPSHGIVPTRGHIPPAPGSLLEHDLNVVGPLARGAEDLALALDVLAGPDTERATGWRLELPPPRRERLSDYRVAAWLDDADFPVDAAVRSAHAACLEALRGEGVTVDDGARPEMSLRQMREVYMQMLAPVEALDAPERVHARMRDEAAALAVDDVSSQALHLRGVAQQHVDWLRLDERRRQFRRAFAAFFEQFDVLLCPVATVAAIEHPGDTPMLERRIEVDGRSRPFIDFVGWIGPANLCLLPATVVPVGMTDAGLPVGIQIVGPYLQDRTPIDFAARLALLTGGFVAPPGT